MIKFEKCPKSRQIVDFFAFANFVGGTPCKISVHLNDHPDLEVRPPLKFREVTLTTPKLCVEF